MGIRAGIGTGLGAGKAFYSSRHTRDTANIRCTVNLPLSFHPGTETGRGSDVTDKIVHTRSATAILLPVCASP